MLLRKWSCGHLRQSSNPEPLDIFNAVGPGRLKKTPSFAGSGAVLPLECCSCAMFKADRLTEDKKVFKRRRYESNATGGPAHIDSIFFKMAIEGFEREY